MPIRGGQLRHPIAFERRGAGTDDYGDDSGAWAELARTQAQFMPGTGQERREAAQERASAAAVFRVRRSAVTAALTEKDRIRFDPATSLPAGALAADFPVWDIQSVVPFGRDGIDIAAVRAR